MSKALTEEEIRKAVHEYCVALAGWEVSTEPAFAVSEGFDRRMQDLFACGRKKHRRKKSLIKAAAGIAAVLAVFVSVRFIWPDVWPSIRNWYAENFVPGNNDMDLSLGEFPVLILTEPPEGFALSSTNVQETNSIQVYENASSGQYIKINCAKLDLEDRNKIDELGGRYGMEELPGGFKAASYSEEGITVLRWYDDNRSLSFFVKSDLPASELIEVFKNERNMVLSRIPCDR